MRKIIATLAASFCMLQLGAQNVSDLIISEVMAGGDSSVVDGYGRRNGWIELYNTSMGTVNFGGCYLTDDLSVPHKSLIPKNDLRTKLGPRQTALFHASGRGEDGTFYTAFEVRRGSTVYLISNDGRTVIDSIEIPSDLPSGMSVSKQAIDAKGLIFKTSGEPSVPSPGIPNGNGSQESGSHRMARQDPHGFVLSIVSVSVVFCALAILWFLFSLLFSRGVKKEGKPSKPAKGGTPDEETAVAIALALRQELSGEEYAAIGLALHLHLASNAHDKESYVITISPSAQSGWTDKRSGFRRKPQLR